MLYENGTIQELMGMLQKAADQNTTSLPAYTKPTNIMSRMYIEQSIVNDECLPPLISMLHQSYVGFILTAMQLNQLVTGTRTVRDIIGLISTETYVDSVELINATFGEQHIDKIVTGIEANGVTFDKGERKLLSGKLIDISLAVEGQDKPIRVQVMVQLLPRFIPQEIAKGFVDLNFDPPLGRRWKQMMAGEIAFFNDFILSRDLIGRHKKALKSDRDSVLAGMLSSKNNSLFKHMLQLVGIIPPKMNTANSILIVNKGTFDKACNDNSLNFELPAIRNKFFSKSFMMCVVVVDPIYHQIEIFYHGIDGVGEYTYNQLSKGAAGGGDKFDLKEIMSTFAGGRPPSF